MSEQITGLYPSGAGHHTSFHVKSSNIKVFPSSWRGAEFVPTEVKDPETGLPTGTYVVDNKTQFNPESVLNTEYNITRTAGGLKTFIDSAREKTVEGKEVWDLKFFVNGYAFEIYNLDLTRHNDKNDANKTADNTDLNLYAAIRVGDLQIGEADLDDTKVLMPFYWTAISTPIPLDANLQQIYLIDKKAGTSITKLTWKDDFYGGVGLDQFTETNTDLYLFTGLILSTDRTSLLANDNYSILQLFKDGQICHSNFWPSEIKGGRSDGKSTIIGAEGLKADVAHMLAVGQFNETTGVDELGNTPLNVEHTIFAVGNGLNDTNRRNAFEVTGYTNNNNDFSHSAGVGPIKMTYSSEKAQTEPDRGDIEGLHLINNRIEVLADGSGIKINRPIDDEIIQEHDIGIHSYGNINILSKAESDAPDKFKNSLLNFKDIIWNDTTDSFDEKTRATIQLVDVGVGTNNILNPEARGLKLDNVHVVNNKALVFRPCISGEIQGNLKTINKGIDIDNIDKYDHSIKIGLSEVPAALKIAGEKITLAYEDGKVKLNKIQIKNDTEDTERDQLHNIAGIYNKNDTSHIKFNTDSDIEISGNVTITGTSKFVGKIDTDTCSDEQNGLRRYICDLIYPVGSIYMCMDAKSSKGKDLTILSDVEDPGINKSHPNNRFGGTWELTSQGRMLLGAGKSTPDIDGTSQTFTTAGVGTLQDGKSSYGAYKTTLPEHSHTINTGTEEQQWTISGHTLDCEITHYANYAGKPNNPTTDYILTENAITAHTHTIRQTTDCLHSHNIPVSFKGSETYSGYSYQSDPQAFVSLNTTDGLSTSNSDLYHFYRNYRGAQSRYTTALKEMTQAAIPMVAMGSFFNSNRILKWCDTPVYTNKEVKPKLTNDKTSNIRTGYFGIPNCTEQDFMNAFEFVFRTTFLKTLTHVDDDWGDGGTGDQYADDEYKVIDTVPVADVGAIWVPTESHIVGADGKERTETTWQYMIDNFGSLALFFNKVFGWTYSTEEVDFGSSDTDNWSYENNYYKVYGKCKRVIANSSNLVAGHFRWLFCEGTDSKVNGEVEKFAIKDAFLRDFLNATGNGTKLHRPDGYHTHIINQNTTGAAHPHEIPYSRLKHYHPIDNTTFTFSGSTASTGISDITVTNLPPYQVCYIWQRKA